VSTGVETVDIIGPWIYSTLSGDSTLTGLVAGQIYGPLTPDEPVGTYVTFSLLSARDIRGVGTARIFADTIYMVKAVAQTTSMDDVLPTFDRVNALLDGKTHTGPSGTVLSCSRNTVISYPEVIEGTAYLHLGGTYSIQAHS
jgi:hypothetical protein